MMTFYGKTLYGKTYSFMSHGGVVTGRDLKKEVAAKLGFPSEKQRLLFCGKPLEDNDLIEEQRDATGENVFHIVIKKTTHSLTESNDENRALLVLDTQTLLSHSWVFTKDFFAPYDDAKKPSERSVFSTALPDLLRVFKQNGFEIVLSDKYDSKLLSTFQLSELGLSELVSLPNTSFRTDDKKNKIELFDYVNEEIKAYQKQFGIEQEKVYIFDSEDPDQSSILDDFENVYHVTENTPLVSQLKDLAMELNVLPRNEEGKYDFASLPSEFKYYLYLKMLVSRAGSLLDDSNRYTPSSALSQAKHRMSRSDQSRYPVLEFFNDLSTDEQDQLLEAYYSESLRHECIDPFNFMPNDQDFPDFASESLPKADIFLAIERDIHRGYLAKVAKEYENSENAGVFDFIVTELQTQLGQRLENASYYNYVLLQELAFIFYPESQHFFDEDHSLVLQESGSVFSKDVVKELLRDEDFRGKITQFLSDYLKTINSFSDTSNVGAVKSLNRRIEQLSQQVESPSCSIM